MQGKTNSRCCQIAFPACFACNGRIGTGKFLHFDLFSTDVGIRVIIIVTERKLIFLSKVFDKVQVINEEELITYTPEIIIVIEKVTIVVKVERKDREVIDRE